MSNLVKIDTGELGPEVCFYPDQSLVEIKGNSIINNAFDLSTSLFKLMDTIEKGTNKTLNLHFALEYFNTPTSRCFYELIKRAQGLSNDGWNVQVLWCYQKDDDDIIEVGDIFKEMFTLPFELKQI